eukprot:scaffold22804_cov74-Phaeocystis_antarctica.AAC.3
MLPPRATIESSAGCSVLSVASTARHAWRCPRHRLSNEGSDSRFSRAWPFSIPSFSSGRAQAYIRTSERRISCRISCFPAIFVEERGFASSLLDIRAASGDDCQSAATAAADMIYAALGVRHSCSGLCCKRSRAQNSNQEHPNPGENDTKLQRSHARHAWMQLDALAESKRNWPLWCPPTGELAPEQSPGP